MVKQLGAHETIDYTKEDYTKTGSRFDIIFDAIGKTSKSQCKHLLTRGGNYVSVTGNPASRPGELLVLKELIESGKLVSVIDRRYTLEQISEAHAYVESFRKKGNVVINIILG